MDEDVNDEHIVEDNDEKLGVPDRILDEAEGGAEWAESSPLVAPPPALPTLQQQRPSVAERDIDAAGESVSSVAMFVASSERVEDGPVKQTSRFEQMSAPFSTSIAADDEAVFEDDDDSNLYEVPPPIDITRREDTAVLRSFAKRIIRAPPQPSGEGNLGASVSSVPAAAPTAPEPSSPLKRSLVEQKIDAAAEAISSLTDFAADFAVGGARRVLSFLHISDEEAEDDFTAVNARISFNKGLFNKFQQLMFKNAKSAFLLWTTFALTEAVVLATYVAGTTKLHPEVSWKVHDAEENGAYFKLRVALSFVSLLQFGFTFALDGLASTCLICTTLYQLGLFFASLSDPLYSQYYVPMFVRAWTLRTYLYYIFDSAKLLTARSPVLDAARTVSETVLSFAALIVSFTGIYRINEAFQGYPTTFVEALYCMIVTCTTVGYGDITPNTNSGKALIVFFVFVFVAELPVVLSQLTSIAEYLDRVKGFAGRSRHVVIVGAPTYKEILTLLNEFIAFSSTRSVVFVMQNEITHRMKQLESTPLYRNRISLLHVEYLRDPLLLQRSKVEDADAVLILSNKNTICAHGDYAAMMASRLFDRYAPHVPQFLNLRYGTHTSLLGSRHTVFVSDAMKKAILSTALLMPGVVPLLVNLVRISGCKSSTPPTVWSAEHTDDWRSLYLASRRSTLHCIDAPLACVTMTLREVVIAFAPFRVLVVGLTDGSGRGADVSLDLSDVVQSHNQIILIAESGGASSSVTDAIASVEQAHAKNRAAQSNVYTVDAAPPAFPEANATFHGSFYPFERTMGAEQNNSMTMMGSMVRGGVSLGSAGVLEQLTERFPFIDKAPRGLNLSALILDVADCHVLEVLFAQLELATAENREKVEREINHTLETLAEAQLAKALDDDRRRRIVDKERVERFVLIDQATSVSSVMLSEFDEDFSTSMAEQSLVMMMQCIRSIYARSTMTLLSLNTMKESFQHRWDHHFGTPLRVVKGQGTLLAHVEHALRLDRGHANVRGVLIHCSQQGLREYEDVPILTVERNVSAMLEDGVASGVLDPNQERNVIVELRTFTSCPFFHPHHVDADWRRAGEDSFQASLPFMMGKCFSGDMLQTLLVHTFYHPSLLKWYELLLNVSVHDAVVNLELNEGSRFSRTRFKFFGNKAMMLSTFGDAFRLLLNHRSCISVGVFRRFSELDGLEGTPRYFITNPHPSMPLKGDDIIYSLYGGRVAGAPRSPSSVPSRQHSPEASIQLTPGEEAETSGL